MVINHCKIIEEGRCWREGGGREEVERSGTESEGQGLKEEEEGGGTSAGGRWK